ncbi:hypothetical protein HPB47_015586 [Ixodes persulcatus]|uniref:Uncharacterized protein n=1 Tax=Ixodes persulcatus TaxID=34615 RepID=A0AC60QVP8_IXOPE|nr:hypothetical protein HPB47_015586 [Ixodes persulcatus]
MALKELPTEDPDRKIEGTPRGVIHGVSPGDAARGIVENAIADYHDILHARPIGNNGTYLITFEGQGTPRSLRLFGRYHNVFPSTAVVCLQCHGLEHKTTVCTRKQRCKTCGEVHPHNQPCQVKHCPNCKKTGHMKRATDERRNHGGGPVATAAKKGGAFNRAPYNPDGFPSLTPQQQQQAEQRKPKPTYSQALDSKVMNMDSVSHLGTPSGCSSRLATELAQLRESIAAEYCRRFNDWSWSAKINSVRNKRPVERKPRPRPKLTENTNKKPSSDSESGNRRPTKHVAGANAAPSLRNKS